MFGVFTAVFRLLDSAAESRSLIELASFVRNSDVNGGFVRPSHTTDLTNYI